MAGSKQKTLILSLARRNSQPLYALNIARKLPEESFDLITSKQSTYDCNSFKNCFSIYTYTNTWTFFFSSIFLLPLQFLMLLPKLVRSYDRLYLPYGHFWDLPFILLFKMLRKPVIYTVHDGILHWGEGHTAVQYLENFRIKRADHLIFLTHFVKQEIKNQFNRSVPTSVIPHGSLVAHFDFPPKLKTDETRILFLGRISRYKGVEMLLEAFEESQLPNTRLIIAGEPIYDFKAREHKAVDYHLEYLSEAKITALLQNADILVLPYLEGTQSGVVSLGISAGLPMICTRVGGLPEQLEEEECIWIEPNKKDLKEALKTLITDAELRAKLREKMRFKNQDLSKNQLAELKQLILGRTTAS